MGLPLCNTLGEAKPWSQKKDLSLLGRCHRLHRGQALNTARWLSPCSSKDPLLSRRAKVSQARSCPSPHGAAWALALHQNKEPGQMNGFLENCRGQDEKPSRGFFVFPSAGRLQGYKQATGRACLITMFQEYRIYCATNHQHACPNVGVQFAF